MPLGYQNMYLVNKKNELSEKIGWEYLGILEEMPIGYQNIHSVIKNITKMKN